MQFLSPIWFTALAALSIPVIIHLWNIRPGKTLKVGSISLITEASKVTRRSFKLLDILLLITRCLLLTLLAMFLAAPVWQRYVSATKTKGWILIPKEEFRGAYTRFKPQVDSLARAGYEFHYFNKGFAKGDLKTLLLDTLTNDIVSTGNYWSLVKQLDNKVNTSIPVSLFTDNNLKHFKGAKPAVRINLRWQSYTQADSTAIWLSHAYFTSGNAIKVLRANSNPRQTWYTTETVTGDGNADIALGIQNGRPFLTLKNLRQGSIVVDTSVMRIAVYADRYKTDANYLKAALDAVTAFTGQKSVVRVYSDAAKIPAGQTWLFWLSDRPVRSPGSKNIFMYQSGKQAAVNSWINADGSQVKLHKSVISADKNESVWLDGFGRPILSAGGHDQANIYRFYSRFNPLWNDLVWSDDFPEMLLRLIWRKEPAGMETFDKRVLRNEVIQPDLLTAATPQTSSLANEQTDLSKYFWLTLVVIFIAERLLSHKTKQVQTND